MGIDKKGFVIVKRGAILTVGLIVIIIAITLPVGIYFLTNISSIGEKVVGKKVLLVGIDAFDPNIVDRLIAEGKLPNFQRVKVMGSYSRLETTVPPESPVAWTAIATGSNPGKYGIFDFINRNPKNYLPKISLAEEKQGLLSTKYESAIRGTPFWRITSNANIPTTVIRWPVTFPAEKIKGRMLSGLGVVDIKGFQNSYKFYTSGEYNKESEGTEKIIQINIANKTVDTKIFGPFVQQDGRTVEFQKPLRIKIDSDGAILTIDGANYKVKNNGWSDWIRVKFNVDFLTNVYGIFKVYLINTTSVFNMYMTTIQIDPENQLFDITYPKDYGKELSNSLGLFYTVGMPEDTKAVTENRISKDVFLQQANDIEDERTKQFWYEFNRFEGGVYAFAFDSSDRIQHIFWGNKVLSGNNTKLNVPAEIENYYRQKDSFLGNVLSKIDDRTSLMIFSDHGFNSFERAVSINTWLVKNGYMALTKQPVGNDAGELFKYVDWKNTKAYSLGFSSIYINVRNREGQGIVDENEKDNVMQEIIQKLSKLNDSKNGKSVVKALYKTSDIYKGQYEKDAPDIIIGFQQGYRMSWQNAVGGLTPDIIIDNEKEWKGDHLIDRSFVPGILFTNFKISKANPSLMDIMPTLLHLLKLKVPKDVDGESLVD